MTDPTTTDDYRAILRTILEDPAADLPRLVLADWLDERGDKAGAARAEFVREHVEYRYRHAGDVGLSAVGGHAGGRVVVAPATPGVAWTVDRGFVSAVTLTQAAFVGGDCAGCSGSGRLAIHGRTHGDCLTCEGTGRTPGLAAALFAAHPVTAVTLTDCAPIEWIEGGFCWMSEASGWSRNAGNAGAFVPAAIYDRLAFDLETRRDGRIFFSAERARQALSAACVDYARDLAGLTALPREAAARPAAPRLVLPPGVSLSAPVDADAPAR